MPSRNNRRWTQAETVMALSLYCQTPFGRMHANNPDVQRVAETVGRTPASIALKLVNFASLDPEHQRRGIKGMSNVSKLDREVWEKYYGQWDALSEQSPSISETEENDDQPTEVEAIVRIRRGQAFFRNSVCAAYENSCCVTGIKCSALVRASHIVPWSVRSESRLDPRNGLLLNTLHDAAFDRGFMTLDESYRVVYAKRLREQTTGSAFSQMFEPYEGRLILLPTRFNPSQDHLDYHRSKVFLN